MGCTLRFWSAVHPMSAVFRLAERADAKFQLHNCWVLGACPRGRRETALYSKGSNSAARVGMAARAWSRRCWRSA